MVNLPKRLKFIGISTNFENDPRYLSLVLRQKKRGRENKNAIISVLICLLTLVAGTDTGYYVKSSEDLRCILSDKTSLPIDEIDDIIEDALKAGIFDSTIYEENKVITGDMFQEAYFSCLKQMRRRLNYPFPFLTPATKAFLADETQDGAGIDGSGCTKNGVFCEKKGDSCTKTGESCTKIEENRIELNEKEREGGITRECPHPLNISETPIEGKDYKFQVVPDLSWIPEEKLQCLEDEVKRELKVLLSMEGWCVKRRESIDETVMKVRRYFSENPYLAIEVLSDTIQAAATHIFPPSDTNRKDAMNRLISLKDGQSVKKTPMIFSYDEIEGSECGRLWNIIIGMAPEEIADDMRKASFVDTGTKTKLAVVASKKVEEWYKNPLVVERICQGTGPSVGGPSGGLTIVFNS